MAAHAFQYAGRPVRQHPRMCEVFPTLFGLERFDRILELGSAAGGLSVWLAEHLAHDIPLPIVSYDLQPPEPHPAVDFRAADILAFPAEICELITGAGRVLVLCDNGDKPKEFRGYATHLKPGDVMMAHDLGFDDWPWYEIKESDVEETCQRLGLEPFHAPLMRTAAWLSRWRPWAGPHGSYAAEPAH